MKEGAQLKAFIDNQAKSKIGIAKDLGISKQTLFQYFQSATLTGEVKKKFEGYFGKQIFGLSGPEEVNTDHILPTEAQASAKAAEGHKLEEAVLNLSETEKINARNIERLIDLLEVKILGKEKVRVELPSKGTPGTKTLARKGRR